MAFFSFFFLVLSLISSHLSSATAHLSSTLDLIPGKTARTNDVKSLPETVNFTDGSLARFIVLHKNKLHGNHSRFGFGFGFCFYCTSSSEDTCYLAVTFVEMPNNSIIKKNLQVVWSANRDKPVGANALLNFSASRNLELLDATNSSVWSSNTSGAPVSQMKILGNGNLVLLNSTGGKVWQSFDHLMDTLLDGQVLKYGQLLTSRIYSKNLSSGLFYLGIDSPSLSAYAKVDDNPIKYLFVRPKNSNATVQNLNYVEFRKANLIFHYQKHQSLPSLLGISNSSIVQLLRLDNDGGLRIHGWKPGHSWKPIYVFKLHGQDECQFPLKCGRYGLCHGGKYESCPVVADGSQYLTSTNNHHLNRGCRLIHDAPSQGTFNQYQLVNFGHLSYFSYFDESQGIRVDYENTYVEKCGRNSSCKAAFFKYETSTKNAYCFLTADVLSLIKTSTSNQKYYSSSYLKV